MQGTWPLPVEDEILRHLFYVAGHAEGRRVVRTSRAGDVMVEQQPMQKGQKVAVLGQGESKGQRERWVER